MFKLPTCFAPSPPVLFLPLQSDIIADVSEQFYKSIFSPLTAVTLSLGLHQDIQLSECVLNLENLSTASQCE